MYRKDLQKLISQGFFAHTQNFFALYGADNFQSELYAQLIKEQFSADESLRVYFEEYDFRVASDYLGAGSLFSERKFLDVRVAKKPAKKELEALISLCKKNKDNFFLLSLYDESLRQNELEKSFENNFCRFFKPNLSEGLELLSFVAKRQNVNATNAALRLLYTSFDENLSLAASELAKFKDLSIDEEAVQKYCFSLSLQGFDSFFDALLHARVHNLEKMLENNNEIALLNTLHSNFYRLFKITLFAKVYGRVELKEVLGYAPPPQVARKLQEQAFRLSLKQFERIFTLLLNAEYELKTNSKLYKKEFFTSVLLELVRILRG